ncbi:MAG TPA: 2-oxo acid dehydrogenase subunit E2 [Anaerolineales bacterium]|nr:2-oxo acid dehydrogenase subunit E2 [Anaerolineales bacterium]
MLAKIIMPQLGESVVEGTVGKWLKNEGDAVKEFEPIMEVTTDKVDTEVTATSNGVLLKILIPAGTTVTAGTLLGWIGQPGVSIPADDDGTPTHAGPHAPSTLHSSPSTASATTKKDLGFISPVVAKLAAEFKVDLAMVKGMGTGGRITKKDVLAFVESGKGGLQPRPQPAEELAPWERPGDGDLFRPTELQMPAMGVDARPTPTPPAVGAGLASAQTGDTVMPLNTMRKSIAEHMVRSKHTSPHVTTVFEVDLSKVVAHREANKAGFARDGVNLTFTVYFVSAAATALKAYPMVNSTFAGDKVVLKREINIGVAVSLGEEGLIVPVVKHADEKSLLGIARTVNDLANRARAKLLKPDEVQGGTFTITNHGVSGSLFATPIISQPQCGILGVGMIQKRAVVINDAIAIRPMCYITLTFDHRILDGALADYFVAKVKEVLEGWG